MILCVEQWCDRYPSQAPSALLTQITDKGGEMADLCWITFCNETGAKALPKGPKLLTSASTSPSKLLLICLPCRALTDLPKGWWILRGQHRAQHHPRTRAWSQRAPAAREARPVLTSLPTCRLEPAGDTTSSPHGLLRHRSTMGKSHGRDRRV